MENNIITCFMFFIDGSGKRESGESYFSPFIIERTHQIIKKYNIESLEDKMSVTKARNFIDDVFGVSWQTAGTLVNNFLKFGLLEKNKTVINFKYKVSIKDIYTLMHLPYYQVMYKGRISHKK